MNNLKLASYLDLANHHPEATPEDIKKICVLVKKYKFNAAFINPCYIEMAKAYDIKVGTVISFPLGQDSRDIKIITGLSAARAGADELDVQMNVGLFKAQKRNEVLEEMSAIVESVKSFRSNVIVKFIIETGLLTDSEIKTASQLVLKSRADFVKTCSGMGPRGAQLTDVKLIREAIGNKIKVKVAGGVTNLAKALAFIDVGADRIGTSKAVDIIEELSK